MWRVVVVFLVAEVCVSIAQVCEQRKIATYNTGLTPFVSTDPARTSRTAKAISRVDADVICLQEVWFEKDLKLLLREAGHTFPYSWSPLHYSTVHYDKPVSPMWDVFQGHMKSVKYGPCTPGTTAPFVWCVLTNCPKESGSALAGCVLQNCFTEQWSLTQTCLTCMTVGTSDVPSTLSRCLGLDRDSNRLNTLGLAVFSKLPITAVREKRFFPGVKQLLPRGYLEVEIEDIGLVVCTHLAAQPSAVSDLYLEDYLREETGISSWEQQNRIEIKMLLSTFQTPHILAGDLNTGPDLPIRNVHGKYPQNYDLLIKDGYTNKYVEDKGICTYCSFNTLVQSGSSSIIDHVLTKGFNTTMSQTLFDKRSITGDHLSDHFGVQLAISMCSYATQL